MSFSKLSFLSCSIVCFKDLKGRERYFFGIKEIDFIDAGELVIDNEYLVKRLNDVLHFL